MTNGRGAGGAASQVATHVLGGRDGPGGRRGAGRDQRFHHTVQTGMQFEAHDS